MHWPVVSAKQRRLCRDRIYASPAVTLEQDLARRDLTINAMAESLEVSSLILMGSAGY